MNWRKSTYSGGNGAECTEVAAVPGAVLVRDSRDPEARGWRSPARRGRRSRQRCERTGAPPDLLYIRLVSRKGRSRVRAALFLCPGARRAGHSGAACRAGRGPLRFRVSRGGAVPGAGAGRAGFRGGRGRRGIESPVARPARPRAGGRAGGGPGEPGKPGFGGFPGFPWRLAGFRVRQVRRGMRGGAALSPGHLRGGVRRCFLGRQEWGSGGKPGTGPFGGPGGSGFSPSAFPDWSPLLSVYSCSRAVVFLTSLSCLVEGVRSGTRRRRGASASAQAAGGTGPETRRTAPALAGAALYGQCAGVTRTLLTQLIKLR